MFLLILVCRQHTVLTHTHTHTHTHLYHTLPYLLFTVCVCLEGSNGSRVVEQQICSFLYSCAGSIPYSHTHTSTMLSLYLLFTVCVCLEGSIGSRVVEQHICSFLYSCAGSIPYSHTHTRTHTHTSTILFLYLLFSVCVCLEGRNVNCPGLIYRYWTDS